MRAKTVAGLCGALIAMGTATSSAWAASKNAEPQAPLTEAGQRLFERYAGMLTELRAQLVKCVPLIEERKQALALLEAEIERQKSKLPSADPNAVLRRGDEADANVARSIVCPGAVVPAGATVIDQLVSGVVGRTRGAR